jgi:putative FmdB family regulatory protein
VPTYQYACTECGHRFEAVQAFTDDSLTTCPVCAGSLRKVYGSVGVVFKGSGFYRTDSRAAATSTAPSNGSGDKPAGDNKSGDKGGDKKVAATTGSGGSSDSSGGSKPSGSSGPSSSASSSSGGSTGGSKAAAS